MRISIAEAEKFAGRRLDRRYNYYLIDGQLCTYEKWTETCSGCFEGGEYMGLAHNYLFDTKRQCYIGAGCDECGYTGKRATGWVVPVAGFVHPAGLRESTPPTGEITMKSTELRLFACSHMQEALPIFESKYPDDHRPRKAVEMAWRFATGEIGYEELWGAYNSACDANQYVLDALRALEKDLEEGLEDAADMSATIGAIDALITILFGFEALTAQPAALEAALTAQAAALIDAKSNRSNRASIHSHYTRMLREVLVNLETGDAK